MNLTTLRNVLPALILANPSLISDSFSFAEIQIVEMELAIEIEFGEARHVGFSKILGEDRRRRSLPE